MKILSLFISILLIAQLGFSQSKDKVIFENVEPGFYQKSILKDARVVDELLVKKIAAKRFSMNQSIYNLPNKIGQYKYAWHNLPISQGSGGTCWDFSTISMFESDIYRLTGQEVKLSEAYVFYWEYVAKAKGFVQSRGKSLFDEGSEGNAVTRIMKEYGIVPNEAYTGLINGRKYHYHDDMFDEMKTYLASVKENNIWNEKEVVATIKSILDYYIGVPPTEIVVNGTKMSPTQYMNNVIKFNPDDYVEILSYMQEPYWKQVEYKVPDNWWHSADYYNVPLNDYMRLIREVIKKGFTISIGGDVSEAGFSKGTQCAMIPDFDIPSDYINEESRQFRFSNKTTTDDHGMHLVGYTEHEGENWYLIKDSSSGSRSNSEEAKEFGYYFFTEDYIKLKMMGFTVHKDAVKGVLKKFN